MISDHETNMIKSISTDDQQIAMVTFPSTSDGIYEAAYGSNRPQACCPRVGYLHPTAEESTSVDPPGHRLSLSRPAGRFKSDQQMAVKTSSSPSLELCEETQVKRPRVCCLRAGYLHPSQEENSSAHPPGHRLSLSGTAIRFRSDQQMAVTTLSSSSLESCEETHVKQPKACCPRAGYLHPTAEESTSADPPGHHLSLSRPAPKFESDQQMARDTLSACSKETCDKANSHKRNPEQSMPADPADYRRPAHRSKSVRPRSSTF